jgi:hypothetical protein
LILSPSDPKTCFKCGDTKTRADFYAHPQMGDGLLGKCKECTKKDARKTRADKLDYYREYDRKRANLPHRVQAREQYHEWYVENCSDRIVAAHRAYHENNPDKKHAHITTGNAIRDGKLVRQPCEVCGKKKSEAHHEDYSKPLEVIWLCKKHHSEADKRRRERERRKMPVSANEPTVCEICA